MTEERRVTKVAWLKLREPFEQVWSGKLDYIEIEEMHTKIRRIGSAVRMDIKDAEAVDRRRKAQGENASWQIARRSRR